MNPHHSNGFDQGQKSGIYGHPNWSRSATTQSECGGSRGQGYRSRDDSRFLPGGYRCEPANQGNLVRGEHGDRGQAYRRDHERGRDNSRFQPGGYSRQPPGYHNQPNGYRKNGQSRVYDDGRAANSTRPSYGRRYMPEKQPNFERQAGSNIGNGSYKRDGRDSSGYDWYTDKNNLSSFVDCDDWKPPLKKDFYNPSKTDADPSLVKKFQADNMITLVKGTKLCNPILKFEDGNFPDRLLREFNSQGFKGPTPIQAQAWPFALSGHDLVAIAQTGSGKTLGYLVPALIHASNQAKLCEKDGPLVLVLAPTRELAQQIQACAENFCKIAGLRVTCLFGGAPKGVQARALQSGVELVIATPGRLSDFIVSGTTNMRRCTFLVLDEADRMLDMGFEPQVRKIIREIRPDRQVMMWSATWPKAVESLAKDFLRDYVHINIGATTLSANHNIEQVIEVVDDWSKEGRLFHILNHIVDDAKNKIIIFVATKRSADALVTRMRCEGFPAKGIHGDKQQQERDEVLDDFRNGGTLILVATDVAARGLDVDDIKFVINFDYPNNSEDYIHRIGRTGRKGRTGTAFTFFSKKNAAKAKDLIEVLKEAKQKIPAELSEMAKQGPYSNRGKAW